MPALFTSMSRRPNRSAIASASATRWSGFAMSPARARIPTDWRAVRAAPFAWPLPLPQLSLAKGLRESLAEAGRGSGDQSDPSGQIRHPVIIASGSTPSSERPTNCLELACAIIAGSLILDPVDRTAFLAANSDVVRNARQATGCLDFVQAADPVDPSRINIFERWDTEAHLLAFRGAGQPASDSPPIQSADVMRYVISAVEEP